MLTSEAQDCNEVVYYDSTYGFLDKFPFGTAFCIYSKTPIIGFLEVKEAILKLKPYPQNSESNGYKYYVSQALPQKTEVKLRTAKNAQILEKYHGKSEALNFADLPAKALNSSDETTDTRFAPIIGASGALLNPVNGEGQGEMFGFIGIKGYFARIDKNSDEAKENPIAAYDGNPWKRFSIIGGIVNFPANGAINYKGEEMKGAMGNLSPCIQLGFDLINQLSLNAGFVFFEQGPKLNSLRLQNDTRLKAAPMVSLALDFNLFNNIVSQFAKKES